MPTAVAARGMISESRLLIQPSLRITINSGTMVTSVGITMVSSRKRNRKLLPGKRYFANAKPAREQKNQLGYAREVFERNAFFDDVTQNKAHARIRWLKRRQ